MWNGKSNDDASLRSSGTRNDKGTSCVCVAAATALHESIKKHCIQPELHKAGTLALEVFLNLRVKVKQTIIAGGSSVYDVVRERREKDCLPFAILFYSKNPVFRFLSLFCR